MELKHISHAFGDQQRFFAWELYYALREEGLLHYLVLLRYLGRRPHLTFSVHEIRAETGEAGRAVARRLAFLSEHGCLRCLSAPGHNGIRQNPSYALSDFGRCVIDCLSQEAEVFEIDADAQRLDATAEVRAHRYRYRYDWSRIDGVLRADIQSGITDVGRLAKKHGLRYGTLQAHLRKTGMIHNCYVRPPARLHDWSKIDPVLRADLQSGITGIYALAKKHGINDTTLRHHLKRTGMLHG